MNKLSTKKEEENVLHRHIRMLTSMIQCQVEMKALQSENEISFQKCK